MSIGTYGRIQANALIDIFSISRVRFEFLSVGRQHAHDFVLVPRERTV
jgi:hypothetical protein